MAYPPDAKLNDLDLTVQELRQIIREEVARTRGGDLLSRQQATDYFGVSVRTIDRWAKKYGWTKRLFNGKKRPEGSSTTVYFSLTEIKRDKELPLGTVRNRQRKSLQ